MMHPQLLDWQGRDDTTSEGPLAVRWHQQVKPWHEESPPGLTLVGFACDEGVKRNQGRIGAARAPKMLRQMLSNLAWRQSFLIFDAGDVSCHDGELETAQHQLGQQVSLLMKSGQRPIVLGGGHETAWGTFLGFMTDPPQGVVGIINLDTHFDLRQSDIPHSGTPFAQMANWCQDHNRSFAYLCLGIAEAANTTALFQRATSLGSSWVTDEELSLSRYRDALPKIETFIKQVDYIYLSIDLDVLPISTMKAVSAPAGYGVPLEVVFHLVQLVAGSGKLLVTDIVEYNPLLDHDQNGARVASRLIWHLAMHWQLLSEKIA